MSKVSLNAKNLETLGAKALSCLVMDLVKGHAGLQRMARMRLSAAQGPDEIARNIQKRFASIRRSGSYLNSRKQKELVKDLRAQLEMIRKFVTPYANREAFELLWSLLSLARSIYERTEVSDSSLGRVFVDSVTVIKELAPELDADPDTLAERIFEAVTTSVYGEFDGVICALKTPLGPSGLNKLKQLAKDWKTEPVDVGEIHEYYVTGQHLLSFKEMTRRQRSSAVFTILSDVADAQGDVDAYMLNYSTGQLKLPSVAANVAQRLLDADRDDEALCILEKALFEDGLLDKDRASNIVFEFDHSDLYDAYEKCLRKIGKIEELKLFLITYFRFSLNSSALQSYLKLLPDFDDIEAEEAELNQVEQSYDVTDALHFLVSWGALDRAARVAITRAEALNGDKYYMLNDVAAALEVEFPLAASIILRAMICDCLDRRKSKRYRYAAQNLLKCQAMADDIEDFQQHLDHSSFLSAIKVQYSKNQRFWRIV